MASHTLNSVNTYMLMAPESLPSAQTSPYKPHAQAFLMPHAYLKFSMPKHCCPCIFCPVGATSTIQSPVLEAWESLNHHCLPPHTTLCQFSLPNASQICVLISIFSPRLPLSLLSFAAQTIAEAPELVSAPGLFPSSHPRPRHLLAPSIQNAMEFHHPWDSVH